MSNLLKKLADKANDAVQARVNPAPVQVPAPAVQAPAAPVASVVVAPVAAAPEVNHAGDGPVDARGIPVFPWPIIVQRANQAQLSSLSPDEEKRLNYWSDNITDGWMGGNLMQNKFSRYKGLYDVKGISYDWRGTVWEDIWKAYVKLPVPEFKAPDAGWAKIDEAYKARAANGGVDPAPAQAPAQTPAPQAGGDEDVSVGS